MITETLLKRVSPQARNEIAAGIVSAYPKLAKQYGLDNSLRSSFFIGQIAHESGNFTTFVENLNYSVDALLANFSRERISSEQARSFGRSARRRANQQEIANIIYGGAWGLRNLGNREYGDGWKYRGRGLIQLTGYANYSAYATFKKLSIERAIEYLETVEGALDSAMWFWSSRRVRGSTLNQIADTGSREESVESVCRTITVAINGGTKGFEDRLFKTRIARSFLV